MLGFSGGVTSVLSIVLGVSAPANAIVFTTFTDRPSWEAAVGGSFSEEDFNSYTADTSFNGTPLDVGDFTLNGTASSSTSQIIDVAPLNFSGFDIDGTPIIRSTATASSSLTATFDSPITAFGATFNGINTPFNITAESDLVGSIPEVATGSTGFFGFTADESFTTLTFDNPTSTAAGDNFSIDNFVYTDSTASVPFEFSPTLGLFAVGGIWGVSRLRKRMAASKITE